MYLYYIIDEMNAISNKSNEQIADMIYEFINERDKPISTILKVKLTLSIIKDNI